MDNNELEIITNSNVNQEKVMTIISKIIELESTNIKTKSNTVAQIKNQIKKYIEEVVK